MHRSRTAVVLTAVLVFGAACAGGDLPPADADSVDPQYTDAETLDGESLDTLGASVSIVQQSQSNIGRIELLGDPQSGTCTSEGDPLVATRYTYEGDWPTRTVRLEASDTTRRATLRMLEVQSTQRAGASEGTESIYVLFTAEGGIAQGRRRYVSTETPPSREEASLFDSDTAQVRQLAQAVLDWCRRPTGAR